MRSLSFVVLVAVAAAGCGPGVQPGDGSGTETGGNDGDTAGVTSAGPTSAPTTPTATDDSSGGSTDDVPQPQLCFEGWTFQEIPGEEQNVHIDLDGDGLDELWLARGLFLDAYSFSDGEATSELTHQFGVGNVANMADVDGDGRKDLLVIQHSDRMVEGAEYYAIDADGALPNVGTPIEYDGPFSGWFVDLDGDGDDDVVRFDNDARLLEVSRNDATSFLPQPDFDLSELIMGSNWLTNVMLYDGGRVVMEFSGGNGSLGDQLVWFDANAEQLGQIGMPGQAKHVVAVEDLDGDGGRDIISVEQDNDVSQLVQHRQEGGGFVREVLSSHEVYSAALGDFEDRGAPQLLFLTADAEMVLLRLDTEEELEVFVGEAPFSRLRGSANYERSPTDEVYLEICEFTCAAGYGRLWPC